MCFKCPIIVTTSTCLILEHVFLRYGFHSCLNIVYIKLQEEMKDLLQNLGSKQSEVYTERWKDDVLRVARGLSIAIFPLFCLGRSISKPGYGVSRYSLYAVYVFVVVRCFPCCCCSCCLGFGCCCCRCCCRRCYYCYRWLPS